jgi:CRP-like cAMP-binding protein
VESPRCCAARGGVVNVAPVAPAGGRARHNDLDERREEGLMATPDELVDAIAGMSLFADLEAAQLQSVAHLFEERFFPEGEKILRQGIRGSAFYVILEGDAQVIVDGQPRAALGRGEFFGEVSILLGEPPVADVVALRPLRCLVIAGPGVRPFLLDYPPVAYRMVQALARRLRNANRWRS